MKKRKDIRPRAPWCEPQEFQKLITEGVCPRCTKSGHFANQCLTFRAAARPKFELNAVAAFDDNDELGMGKDTP